MNRPSSHDAGACMNLQMLRLSHYVLKAFDEAYRGLGVRATQVPVLDFIAARGAATIRDIAEALESERSVMFRKLQVMDRNGWVTVGEAGRGKEKAYTLTAAGRELVARTQPARDTVQDDLLERLSAEEQRLLLSLCGKLRGGGDAGDPSTSQD
jgi:DNA-binding MarR family transcriptional regulator